MQFFALRALFVLLVVTTSTVRCGPAAKPIKVGKDLVSICEKVIKLDIYEKVIHTPLFKKAAESVPYLGVAFAAFELIDGFINPVKDTPEEKTQRQLKEISNKLDEISSSISSLNDVMITEFSHLTYEIKVKSFRDLSVKIDNFEQQFYNLINTFNDTTDPDLIKHLTKFIDIQSTKSYENRMVALFDIHISVSQSIVDEIIEYGRKRMNVYEPKMDSSTAKMIYDFYHDVMKKILNSFTLRELAINMRHLASPNDNSKDFELLQNEKKLVMEKFIASFEKASTKLNDTDSYGFLSLKPSGDDKNVKFKNVYQLFIGIMDDISDIKHQGIECHTIKNQTYNKDGCYGSLNDCWSNSRDIDKFIPDIFNENRRQHKKELNSGDYWSFYQRQEPQVDRIYDVYSYFNSKWKGLPYKPDVETTQLVRKYRKLFDDNNLKIVQLFFRDTILHL